MLKKLLLENWKSHHHTEIEFENGYNVIVGNIGSGKSSIIDAIVFALFGTTQSIMSKKIQVKDLIMTKPMKMDSATIILEFVLNNKNYKIERILFTTKSSQAKLYENEKLIRGPKPQDVNDEIEAILGINIDTFMRANYSEQNQIDFFLKMPANQRKQLFDNLFDIDYYDTISVNSRQVSNKLVARIEQNEKLIIEYNAMLKQYNIDELNKIKSELNKTIAKDTKELSETKATIDKLKTMDNEHNLKLKQREELENKINSARAQIEFISSEITLDNLKPDILEQRNIINNEIKELKEKNELFIKTKNELEHKKIMLAEKKERLRNYYETIKHNVKIIAEKKDFEICEKKIKELITHTEIIKSELKKFDEQHINTKSDLDSISREIGEIKNSITKIDNIDGKCPTCEQTLDSEHKLRIVSEKNLKIKELYEKQLNINSKLIKIKEELTIIEKKKTENENEIIKEKEKLSKKEIIAKFEIENQELEKKVMALEKDIIEMDIFIKNNNELDAKIDELKEKLDLAKTALDKTLKIEKYFELKTNLDKNLRALQNIEYTKETHDKLKKEIIEIEISVNHKKIILDKDKKLFEENEFKLKQIKELKEKLKQEEDKILHIKTVSEDLMIFSNVAKKTQEEIRLMMIKKVNDIFMDLWPKIYPYNDFSKILLNIVDGDYKLELYFDKDYKRQLDDFVSGGERSAIALTLRLAMSLVMKNKLNMIILDEPTHNLDETSVLALSDLFNNHLLKFVNQIFVITHDKQLEHYAKNIYYIKRDKDNDGPSAIEKI